MNSDLQRYLKVFFICSVFILFSSSLLLAKKSRDYPRYQECLSNQRVIMGAIEMYNLDNSTLLENLDEDKIKMLVDKGYLKISPRGPETSCKYLFTNKYSENGDVYCEYHGGVDSEKLKPCPKFEEYLKSYSKSKISGRFEFWLEVILVLMVWVGIIYTGIEVIKIIYGIFVKPDK